MIFFNKSWIPENSLNKQKVVYIRDIFTDYVRLDDAMVDFHQCM